MHQLRTVRVMQAFGAVVAVAVGLAACAESAVGPNQAAITFTTDPISCPVEVALEIVIDGESQGNFAFGPGSSTSFPVAAGEHSVQATGELPDGGFIALDRDVTVQEATEFVVVITCSA